MAVLTAKAKDTYMGLINQFPLVTIKSDSHLTEAQGVVDSLLRQKKLDSGSEEYLAVLSDLIGDYEDEHHPIAKSSPVDVIRHLLVAHSVSQAQVCTDTGIGKSTLSQFLSGRRELSKANAKVLAGYFQVDLSLLI